MINSKEKWAKDFQKIIEEICMHDFETYKKEFTPIYNKRYKFKR